MSSFEYYGGGAINTLQPSASKVVLSFLARPGGTSNEAWVLARGGINSNGALKIRLVDEYGSALSDYVEVFSSTLTRAKFTNVKIVADGSFPAVLRVEAHNKSTATQSVATVEGVGVVYNN